MNMKPVDILQKAYAKIEEFRKWNNLAESAKLNYEIVAKQVDETSRLISIKEKELEKITQDFNAKKEALEAELLIIQNKISKSKSDFIQIDKENSDKIKNSSKEVESLEKKEKELKESTNLLDTKNSTLGKDRDSLKEEMEFIKSNIKNLEKMSSALNAEIEESQKELREATETIEIARERMKAVEKRESDLGIYERRIQKYYNEANLNIKI